MKERMYSLASMQFEQIDPDKLLANKARWEEVFARLKDAKNLEKNPRLKPLVENKHFRRSIASMVYLGDDNTTDWIPKAAEMFIEITDDAFKNEEEQMRDIRGRSTEQVKGYIALMKKHIERLAGARKEYTDNGGKPDDLEIDLAPDPAAAPAAPFAAPPPTVKQDALTRVEEIQKNVTISEEDLRNRQRALIALAHLVLSKTPKDKLKTTDITNLITGSDFGDATNDYLNVVVTQMVPIINKLQEDPDPAKFPKYQEDLLKIIEDAGTLPLAMDSDIDKQFRKDLQSARAVIEARIQLLIDEESKLMTPEENEYIRRRDAYLEFLAGTDLRGVIAANITRPEYKLDSEHLAEDLKNIAPDVEGITAEKLLELAGIETLADFRSHVNKANLQKFRDRLKKPPYEVDLSEDDAMGIIQGVLLAGVTDNIKRRIPGFDESLVPHMLACWDQSALLDYLKERSSEFRVNPTVDAVGQLMERAFLSKEEAQKLREVKLANMSVSTMVDIASLDVLVDRTKDPATGLPKIHPVTGLPVLKKAIDGDLAEELIKMFAEKDPTNLKALKVNKKQFKEVMTFLMYKDLVGGAAQTKVDALLESIVTTATDTGFKDAPNEISIGETDLEGILDGIAIGTKTHELYQGIRKSNLRGMKWTESARKITLESFNTMTEGGALWWGWISSMPGFYLDSELNAKLLPKLNQRRALGKYQKAINTMLGDPSTRGKAQIKLAIKRIRTIKIAQQRIKDRPNAASTVYEDIDGAIALLKATEFIDRNLGASWRNMPPQVRDIAYWLAMNKATKDDEGNIQLDVAEQFVNQWNNLGSGIYAGYVKEFLSAIPADQQRQLCLQQMLEKDFKQLSAVPETEFEARKEEYIAAFVAGLTDVDRQNIFVQNFFINNSSLLKEEDLDSLKLYLGQINNLEEIEGGNVLNMGQNRHGITVRPLALQGLMGLYQTRERLEDGTEISTNSVISSMLVSRWAIDRDRTKEQKQAVAQALHIVLAGPLETKTKLIDAYINRRPTSYTSVSGEKIEITPKEAEAIIDRVAKHLKNVARNHHSLKESLEKEDLFVNPLERGLRATIDVIKDMWGGDGVDKVILGVTAVTLALLIKHLLKKNREGNATGIEKLGFWGVVSVPVILAAIVGNAAYRNRTGRDKLGEWTRYVNKDERQGAFWQYFGKLPGSERYKDLHSNAGQEALKQVKEFSVEELLAWRQLVQTSGENEALGYNDYKTGAPDGLDIGAIQAEIGIEDSEDDAYHMAFLAFESVCVFVAVQSGRESPDPDYMAEQGADIMRSEYVDHSPWRDRPDIQAKLRSQPVKLAKVINDKMVTPELFGKVEFDRNTIEWFADAMGWTAEKAQSEFSKLSTKAKLAILRGRELVPELASKAWDTVSENAEDIYDWMRITGRKGFDDFGENASASWRALLNTLSAAGIVIKKGAVGAVEVSVDLMKGGTDLTVAAALNIYRAARSHQGIGNLMNGIEAAMAHIFEGTNFAELLAKLDSVKTDDEYVRELAKETNQIALIKDTLGSITTLPADIEAKIRTWRDSLAPTIRGGKTFAELNPNEKLAVYELLKRRLHSLAIAARLEAINGLMPGQQFAYPIDLEWNWDKLAGAGGVDIPLADEIEQTFGINSLSLIGAEQDLAGMYQEWLQTTQSAGMARKPLEFLYWVLDYGTFDNATQHMQGEIELYKRQFMDTAEEAYKDDPNKNDKLEEFGHYLETVLTNVALEASMGAKRLAQIRNPAAADNPKLFISEEISNNLLDYIRLHRGSSADASRLKEANLKPFESKNMPTPELDRIQSKPGVAARVRSANPNVPMPVAPAGRGGAAGAPPPIVPATPPQVRKAAKTLNIAPDVLTPDELDELLKMIPRSPTQRAAIQRKFRDVTKALTLDQSPNLNDDDLRHKANRIIQGLDDPVARGKVMDNLIDHYTGGGDKAERATRLAHMGELAALRQNSSPQGRARIQDVLDHSIIGQIEDMIPILDNITNLDAMPDAEIEADYIKPLIDMYKQAKGQGDILADSILLVIEHALYHGRDNQKADASGKVGFAKFQAYMQKHGVTVPSTAYYVAGRNTRTLDRIEGFPGSATRMRSNIAHRNGELRGQYQPRLNDIKTELAKQR